MLRIQQPRALRLEAAEDTAPAPPRIATVFDDPVLELGRLLREAANIEHALMVQYLFAAFSLKPAYAELAGSADDSNATLIGIAVQEMRHFARVNELLVAIGAAPNLDREDFPFRTDIYPFVLELEPLTLDSVAKYVTAEAPPDALDPGQATSPEERAFRLAVAEKAGQGRINHIGGLYTTIIACLQKAVAARPNLLADSATWVTTLNNIKGQGEHDHFLFFRSLFEATHPALGNKNVWSDPASDIFPSLPLKKNPTALDGADWSADPVGLGLSRLSNLHYWCVLVLINLSYVAKDPRLMGRAIAHMRGALYPVAQFLAAKGRGVPFDSIGLNFGTGSPAQTIFQWVIYLIGELQSIERGLPNDLPLPYAKATAKQTLLLIQEKANGLLA
jgi:hypothetical protein